MAAAHRGDDPEGDADGDRHDQRGDRDLEAVRQPLEDQIQRRAVVVDGVAEVQVRELPEPGEELERQRLVEPERMPKAVALLRRHVVLAREHELNRV